MSNSIENVKLGYLRRIEEQIKGLNGHAIDASNQLKLHARDVFQRAEFPGRKSEDWKYTSVKPILSRVYESSPASTSKWTAPAELDALTLHFLNGQLTSVDGSANSAVYVGKLSEAWQNSELRGTLETLNERIKSAEMGPFESMALGMDSDPLIILVPQNAILEKPIHVVYETVAQDNSAVGSQPYRIIALGKNAAAKVIETYVGESSGSEYYTNTASRIFVAANANLKHYRLQTESYNALHTSHTNVMQERDSTYSIQIAELGSKLVRDNVNVVHTGENITSNIYGLFIAQDRQHIDTQSFIDHAMPHCESNELFKGILTERGRGVFNGKIIVRPDAQKINAYQQNAALVLSRDATMDSKPQLEIYADDVRCSHGATIGQLDPDSLFYLKTRGLNDIEAKALLKRAFLKDVIDNFPDEDIANYFLNALEAELEMIAQKSTRNAD